MSVYMHYVIIMCSSQDFFFQIKTKFVFLYFWSYNQLYWWPRQRIMSEQELLEHRLEEALRSNAAPATAATILITTEAVHLPTFTADHVAHWFSLAEGRFHLRHLTDQLTQFYHVQQALHPTVVRLLAPEDLTPAVNRPYEIFRERIRQVCQDSPLVHLERFLSLANQPDTMDPAVVDSEARQCFHDIPDLALALKKLAILRRSPADAQATLRSSSNFGYHWLFNPG